MRALTAKDGQATVRSVPCGPRCRSCLPLGVTRLPRDGPQAWPQWWPLLGWRTRAQAGTRSCVDQACCVQYDVELVQRIEALTGETLAAFDMDERETLKNITSVFKARKAAIMRASEQASKAGVKVKRARRAGPSMAGDH